MSHPHERRGEIGGTRRPGPDRPSWMHWLWKVDWAWRRIVPLIALGLAMVAVIGVSNKVDKANLRADHAKLRADRAADTVRAIQQSRKEAAIDACLAQNASHLEATTALAQAPPRANVDKRVVQGLIDALAKSYPNCIERAEEIVHLQRPTPTPTPR